MSKKRNPVTACELLKQLSQNHGFVRRDQQREQKRRELEALLRADEQPLVAELTRAGCTVNSVWDLVNTKTKYSEAIPVLVKHLQLNYHVRNLEGIARALTVPEARGRPAQVILHQLKLRAEMPHGELRFALANALAATGDAAMRADIELLLADPRFKDLQNVLILVLEKISARTL
ncbi:MAG: hypothetical protein HS122_17555 [Opitutaceae bacterium]|nr:hypothetical protein [Opitutaceae bacterium]